MPISEATYRRVALEDTDSTWERWCGRLVEKPIMTTEHNETARNLLMMLAQQLPHGEYSVGERFRLRRPNGDHFVPDVCVVPKAMIRQLRERPRTFEVYNDPVPFVTEVWSPSTGRYDVATKLGEYRERGDLEIWFIHPYDHTLQVWRKQTDGSYAEAFYTEGVIQIASLPGVDIDLAELFACEDGASYSVARYADGLHS
jgi:Uma2 family endonuclease